MAAFSQFQQGYEYSKVGVSSLNISGINTSQMALVELEIVNQFFDEVIRDRRVTLTGMVGTLGEIKMCLSVLSIFMSSSFYELFFGVFERTFLQ